MAYGALTSTKLVSEGRFEEAVTQATKEIGANPADPEILFNRGQALVGLGRFQDAVQDYQAALALDGSESALDPACLDDEFFFALRELAVSLKADQALAAATLARYRELLPHGRHVDDVNKWLEHLRGVETVWVRDRV
jgi:tetratricopeptide (TPR) repeat protein